MHELCPIRGREAEVALSLDTPFAELLPGVVIEFDCGATAALAKRRRQTPQAAEASASAFSRTLKMAESAPAGAIDATIHALDVVFLAVAKRFDEGIIGAADWAKPGRYGEWRFRH